jgi:hypothetical protein
LALGGERLPNGDINMPIDPELMHSQYDWTILPEARRLLQDDWLPGNYKALVLQQLKLFTQALGECPRKASVDALREELRTAAFEVLKRLALQIRELEHPQRDDTAGSRDTK